MGSPTYQQNDICYGYCTVHLQVQLGRTHAGEQTLSAFNPLPSCTAKRNFKILPLEDSGLYMWT